VAIGISWLARDSGTNSELSPLTIYSARVGFDGKGQITGLAQPPALLVRAAQSHSWSPEGTQLAYETKAATNADIHILDLRTRQTRKLTEGSAPIWSPDGSRIAFRRGHRTIHTIQPDGFGLQTVARREERPGVRETYPESGYYELVWSPDATMLLYGFFELGGDAEEVFRIASAGGQPRLLTRSVLDSASPVAWLKGEN